MSGWNFKVSAYTLANKPVLKAKLITAANDLGSVIHPVVKSAQTLASNHEEPCYIENMDVIKYDQYQFFQDNFFIFRAEWDTKLRTLTDAVNESVDVVDFLAHSQVLLKLFFEEKIVY